MLDIWAYIARENAPSVADAVLARIHGALEVLAFAPKIGRERNEFSGTPRSFVVRPYIVFYEALPDDTGILVWRITHGARDLQRVIHPPQR